MEYKISSLLIMSLLIAWTGGDTLNATSIKESMRNRVRFQIATKSTLNATSIKESMRNRVRFQISRKSTAGPSIPAYSAYRSNAPQASSKSLDTNFLSNVYNTTQKLQKLAIIASLANIAAPGFLYNSESVASLASLASLESLISSDLFFADSYPLITESVGFNGSETSVSAVGSVPQSSGSLTALPGLEGSPPGLLVESTEDPVLPPTNTGSPTCEEASNPSNIIINVSTNTSCVGTFDLCGQVTTAVRGTFSVVFQQQGAVKGSRGSAVFIGIVASCPYTTVELACKLIPENYIVVTQTQSIADGTSLMEEGGSATEKEFMQVQVAQRPGNIPADPATVTCDWLLVP